MHIYNPVGRCIYCGNSSVELTDEHIIPLGLAGGYLLPKSSCKKCASVTGRFEGIVLRTMLGDIRMRNNFPTRRKKERPKTKTINTELGKKSVPVGEYPAPYMVYNFETAGIIVGLPPHVTLSHKVPTIIGDPTYETFKTEHKWDGILRINFQPDIFRRFLLKIGHGFAVAHLGCRTFRHLAVPYFMTDGQNLSFLVGQNADQEAMESQWLHKSRINILRLQNSKWLVMVEIRIFAGAGTPTYHAIVGDFESSAQVDAMLEFVRRNYDKQVSIQAF